MQEQVEAQILDQATAGKVGLKIPETSHNYYQIQ